MDALSTTDQVFYGDGAALDPDMAAKITAEALDGTDDGEFFAEYRETEALALEDGRIRTANFDTAKGFGLRAVHGEETGYAHAGEISAAALQRAAASIAPIRGNGGATMAPSPASAPSRLYRPENPLLGQSFATRAGILSEIDAYARARDKRVVQVMASLMGEWQAVQILRGDGSRVADLRPLVRLNVAVVVEQDGKREQGSHGLGGRQGYDGLLAPETWQAAVEEALRQAVLKLDAVAAPAGEMDVVLGAGWPGILLHEAIGHGLEGDFNRRGTSAFAGLLGQRIAAPGVTVIDDGTLAGRRGSLTIDDEGTPTNRTVLIEDGVLVGFLQDRLNARLMGVAPTGNGRRESYAHTPLPRMTNTMMLGGTTPVEESPAPKKDFMR
jgi:TldD protein